MMIDVDDFKSYNDRFSHLEGDQALRLIAACLKVTVRASDITARYGGEEFVVLLPQTNSAEAQIIAERFRQRVASEDFPCRAITVSIGVSSLSTLISTATDMMRAADQALYKAKRSGRNNVQVFDNAKELN
jgi:diguanylate cyclase (GGDEF)-like protein